MSSNLFVVLFNSNLFLFSEFACGHGVYHTSNTKTTCLPPQMSVISLWETNSEYICNFEIVINVTNNPPPLQQYSTLLYMCAGLQYEV